jgi:hypothetical protein
MCLADELARAGARVASALDGLALAGSILACRSGGGASTGPGAMGGNATRAARCWAGTAPGTAPPAMSNAAAAVTARPTATAGPEPSAAEDAV